MPGYDLVIIDPTHKLNNAGASNVANLDFGNDGTVIGTDAGRVWRYKDGVAKLSAV